MSRVEMLLAKKYIDAGYKIQYAPYIHNQIDIAAPTIGNAYKRLFMFSRWLASLRYHLPLTSSIVLQVANCVAWTPNELEAIIPWSKIMLVSNGFEPEIQLERCVAGDGPGPAETRPLRADCAALDIAREYGMKISMWDHDGLVKLNYLFECL